jgi:phage portal protein BeeE
LLADLIRRRSEVRATGNQLSMPDYLRLWEQFGYNGVSYVIPGGNIVEMTALMAQRNPIVAACIMARQLVFSDVRLAYRRRLKGQVGPLYTDQTLSLLQTPWPQGTTSDLFSRMEVDGSLFGNSYWVNSGERLTRLDPPCVKIVTGDVDDVITGKPYGKVLLGYIVEDRSKHTVATFMPDEVAHYRPQPDPNHEFRGLSWLGSLLPDVVADMDLSDYKHAFLANAATPNIVFSFTQPIGEDALRRFMEKVEGRHTGPQSGFKSLYLGAGVDAKVVGSNFSDLAMDAVQSAGATRIAAAAGVPPSLMGISEGLKGSALNAGNYASARRNFSDRIIRPNWRSACGALQTLLGPLQAGVELWYDDRETSFLQADMQDAAEVRQADSATLLNLINSGFVPDTAVLAVRTGDWSYLEHTGLISVQMQPIKAKDAEDDTIPIAPVPIKGKGIKAPAADEEPV